MNEDYKCKNCGYVFRIKNFGQYHMFSNIACPKCFSNAVDRV